MLEIWLVKSQSMVREPAARVLRWLRLFPPAVWIILIVISLVGGRLAWVAAGRPAHRQQITAAFGSASLFFGTPQVNHDGSQCAYVATDAKGYALFVCNSATGSKQIVCEENGLGPFGAAFDLQAWPWSPDDSGFIYTAQNRLFVCPAETNVAPVSLAVGANPRVSEVVWLNVSEFAWLEGEAIGYAKKQADGKWEAHKLPHKGQISNLTATGPHTLAWLQENYICHYDLAAGLGGTNNPFIYNASRPPSTPLTNDLVLWLDASTLRQTNQAPVTVLADLSPKKNNAIPNQNPPLYNAPTSGRALHGKGTIHFTSSDAPAKATGLKTSRYPGLTNTMPRTVFAVLRREANHQMTVGLGEAGGKGTYFGLCDNRDALYLPCGWSFLDNKVPPTSANWNVLEVVYDGISQKGYVNGVLKRSEMFQLNTTDKAVEIGLWTLDHAGRKAAGSDGDFAELLIYDRALTDAEQRQVEDYLAAKWFGARPLWPQSPLVWLQPGLRNLTGFACNPAGDQLLLRQAEADQASLWRLDAPADATNAAVRILQDRSLRAACWLGSNEIAYLSGDLHHPGLVLADASGQEQARLLERENPPSFTAAPDRQHLFFVGAVSNEPTAGIWRYDLAARQLRPVVGGVDQPSAYARNLNPCHIGLRLPSGRGVDCFLYPPAHFDRHRKYPLVIGYTVFGVTVKGAHGRLWAPGIATCGAFVAIINRDSWFPGIDKWGENVMGVYQNLARNPCVNTDRVFLFGASAETRYMGQFMAQFPGLWKGAILLNPSGLPDFSTSPTLQSRPKILISAGGAEHEADRLKRFQAEALNSGVLTEIVVHPGENHHLVGNAAQLERTMAMMHFIFEE